MFEKEKTSCSGDESGHPVIFHSFSLQRNVVTKDVPIVVKSFSQKKFIKEILKVVMPKTAKSVFIVSISKEFLAVYAVCIWRMYRYKERVRRRSKVKNEGTNMS